MEDYKKLAGLINHLPFDIRVEILAADLIEQGIDAETLVFKPVSRFKRRFSNDITGVKVIETQDDQQQLYIEVTRDGIYDSLPQGLFHQPKIKAGARKRADMVENVRTTRAEEQSARQFFQPMENELYHLRTTVERTERRLFFDLERSERNDLLINFWNLEAYRRFATLPLLVRLMPILYRLSGHLEYTKTCYELLLRVPIAISIYHDYKPLPTHIAGWQLGGDSLGFETITSEKIYNELPVYEITIGPLKDKLLADYLPGGKMLPYLNLLNSYFLAAGYAVNLTVLPQPKDCVFDFAIEDLHLGVNTAFNL